MKEQRARSVCRLAPAKINLTLRVLGRRPDGFHELSSLVIGVELTDRVGVAEADSGRITLSCASPELSTGEDNLVVRAARLLAEHTRTRRGARIDLEKRVPIAAGLGGGSSDAAAALKALDELWGTGLSDCQLASLGARIGSDVPLFFHLPAAVIRGRGEVVEPVTPRWSGWAVLVFGGVPVSTPQVYAQWDADGMAQQGNSTIEDILEATRADEIGPLLHNDLEPAVFRVCPAVEDLLNRVRDAGARFARVSGAGSTIYSLRDDEGDAQSFAGELRRRGTGAGVAVVRAPGGDVRAL